MTPIDIAATKIQSKLDFIVTEYNTMSADREALLGAAIQILNAEKMSSQIVRFDALQSLRAAVEQAERNN